MNCHLCKSGNIKKLEIHNVYQDYWMQRIQCFNCNKKYSVALENREGD